MDELEGINLVNKFPPFTSISVVDNVYATLWAGIVQDLEALVDEFIMSEGWDYASFLRIAEHRDIVVLHRSAFSLFPGEKGTAKQAGHGSTRGRHKEQLQAYRRIVSIIFNVAKDIWLEPQTPLPSRNNLVDLKRSVVGLYTLYYLWHNQIASDENKVSIRYSPQDQMRAKAVGESFLCLEEQIPGGMVAKNCYKYLVTALSKRNAFCYCYIVDEPKMEFLYWQLMYLKHCSIRKTLTAINSSSRFYDIVPILESTCKLLVDILNESSQLANIVPNRSVFFRHMIPLSVTKNAIMINEKTFKPTMKLPFDYLKIASEITKAISDNVTLVEKPFLTLDALLQTDRAPLKIQGLGCKIAKSWKKKYEYNKREYEKTKTLFNKRCEEQHVPTLKVAKTRKYRPMTTPGWLFITKRFASIFDSARSVSQPQSIEISERAPEPSVIGKPQILVNISSGSSSGNLQIPVITSELPSQDTLSPQNVTVTRPGTRTSERIRQKKSDQSSKQPAAPAKKYSYIHSTPVVSGQVKICSPVSNHASKLENQIGESNSCSSFAVAENSRSQIIKSNLQSSRMEVDNISENELLDNVPIVSLESSGEED